MQHVTYFVNSNNSGIIGCSSSAAMQRLILQQENTTCLQCAPCAGTAAVAAKAAAAQVAVVRHCGINPKQSQDRACKRVALHKRAMQGAAGGEGEHQTSKCLRTAGLRGKFALDRYGATVGDLR